MIVNVNLREKLFTVKSIFARVETPAGWRAKKSPSDEGREVTMCWQGKLERLDGSGIFIDHQCTRIRELWGNGLIIYVKQGGIGFGAEERFAVWEADFKAFMKKHYPYFDIDAYLAEMNKDMTPEALEQYRLKGLSLMSD